MKFIRTYRLLFILVLALPFWISLWFPGKLSIVDFIRLKVQEPIMNYLSEWDLENLENSEYNREVDIFISFTELKSYLSEQEPGSLFFTSSKAYASYAFIKGDWKHAAIYLGYLWQIEKKFGKQSELYKLLKPYYKTRSDILIIDSSKKGVQIRSLKTLENLASHSHLRSIVFYKIASSTKTIQTFITNAIQHIGKPFDYDLITHDNSQMYCSELIYTSLNSIGISIDKGSYCMGRSYYSPSDIVVYIKEKGIAHQEFSEQYLLLQKQKNSFPKYSLKKINHEENLHRAHHLSRTFFGEHFLQER